MEKHQQRPQLRNEATHATDVQAPALERQELAQISGDEFPDVQSVAPPVSILQEDPCDALASGNGPWRKPPLKN
jgi:hypothetical protein